MDRLIHDIYVRILKYGYKYKTVDKIGNDVYIDCYAPFFPDVSGVLDSTLVSRHILKPKTSRKIKT